MLSDEQLQAVKGLAIGNQTIKFIDDFSINEEKLISHISISYNNYCDELREYFQLYKKAWIPRRHDKISNYEINIDNLDEELFPQFTLGDDIIDLDFGSDDKEDAVIVSNISKQHVQEPEPLQNVVIANREFKTSVKIVFCILVVALIAIAFT